ncbi:hypothetical protein DL237_04295 [Pseudooceanicola sediminis]|uniref:Uncharacterized protein n=1 Tax=Pseudooceanicola sediminis TaxID=2211117 RepID=A0A399J3D6_9RHOB|nr:hypothetical protein [Pseudooceanicola sediminis]KAA2314219.1 hypothetical protein E0K93_11260 [Puniceibacterium sp. HSS470]RII39923.1 hypothetical protein DL237_04295 [Pseudooceanicola sediminis]|tara:strand:+ start:88671 stop:89144 length:474 start_codon:yes stop_codon:yes gene_type:complete
MPHDHPHHHHGHHDDHHHDHTHGHDHRPPAQGHNGAHAHHLHSHAKPEDDAADLQVLTAQFIDGFVTAADKASYLKLAGVPLERAGQGGETALKLVDIELKTEWQVGTASPSFGSRELSYLPFPGQMVRERTNMSLVYVSSSEKVLWDIRDFLRERL